MTALRGRVDESAPKKIISFSRVDKREREREREYQRAGQEKYQ